MYALGSTKIEIERTQYEGATSLTIVHVHDNETTARKAAEDVLKEFGGSLVTLKNNEKRILKFTQSGKGYEADPNRIFTEQGRENTLKKLSKYSPSAAGELDHFARYFISLIPEANVVISMHNNTNKAYSVLNYNKDGVFYTDVKAIHITKRKSFHSFRKPYLPRLTPLHMQHR